ncbi:MAG: Gfo/Idh/MocA family oxidoreductase [Deltaproteobacteria bacterium]|nr:Gfo/Idh/MocA family oxidoreductase [Deltaproteobacteria bacterium]
MPKNICVVGAGQWGKNHIRTLNDLGFLGGVVEASAEARKELSEIYPDIKLFASVKEAIKENFDGFTVATPAETHFRIAEFLISQKKHVLVEKPITLKAEDARKLKKLSEENGTNLMVGHLLLFHPAIRKIKELIENGKIGKLEYIYSNRLNLGTVRTEENILWSFAPHDISIFQYLIGSFPKEIISRGGVFLRPDNHDSSMTVLTYPDNVVGHIFVSWLHPFKEHRIVVIGSKGMFSYEDSSDEKNILFYEKGIDWVQGEPIKRDGPTEVIPYERRMPLAEELQYFVDHLNGDPIEIADAQNAVEVLEILELASHSLLGNATPLTPPPTSPNPLIHKTAEIDEGCIIGDNTKVWHFSHILSGSQIGKNCNIGQNVVIGPDVSIGNNCKIQNNVSVYKGVTLEDGVFCGPSMVFTNVYNPRAEIRKMDQSRPTLVKKGATIGANATVVCGNTIGRYAFIGAGAVVTKDVQDHALMAGNPSKQIGWVCECGETLNKELTCPTCRKLYAKGKNGLNEK